MTDTERVVEIIKEKGLSNVQFCNTTGIAPASLSHIISGRSNPTLATLRSVIAGFPDLNPEWVFQGTGSMYKSLGSAVAGDASDEGLSHDDTLRPEGREPSLFNNEQMYPEFNFAQSATDRRTEDDGFGRAPFGPSAPTSQGASQGGGRGQGGGGGTASGAGGFSPHSAAVKTLVADTVRETVAQLDRPKRRIVEVRVFFDDGTYESFCGVK